MCDCADEVQAYSLDIVSFLSGFAASHSKNAFDCPDQFLIGVYSFKRVYQWLLPRSSPLRVFLSRPRVQFRLRVLLSTAFLLPRVQFRAAANIFWFFVEEIRTKLFRVTENAIDTVFKTAYFFM